MKFKSLILLFVSLFVLFSCDDGIKFDNPLDERNRTSDSNDTEAETESDDDKTDTESEYDDEKTDTASTNDEENQNRDDSDSGNSMQDDADSTDDSGDSVPDENNSDNDSADSVSDDDSDSTLENDDTDIPTNPCDPNPCTGISNSTGVCTVSNSNYICGCTFDYTWTGSTCKKLGSLTLGNICTGQIKCYDNDEEITCPTSSSADFYGQDAQYTSKCTAQSFSSSTNVVIDNNTGLSWEKSPSSSTYTWDDAPNHCNDLNNSNFGGINTWRVPNPLEFLTIVDNSKVNPATNSNFTNMPSDDDVWFWTSAEYKGNTSYAYAFKPYYGSYYGYYGYDSDDSYLKTKTYKVLCVSGEEMQLATSSNFTTQTISGSVVVTDSKTGLMWQKEYDATGKTWQEALKYCEDSTYAGYSDWRLPNKNELASLINYEKSGASYSYFPDMPNDRIFRSSSTSVHLVEYSWNVDFRYGRVYGGDGNCLYVRCVRNAK